jgi:serine/threonine protein kinase
MYYLLSGKNPFSGNSEQEVVANNFACNIDFTQINQLNPLMSDFLKQLFTADPILRPSANEALHHPWFKDIFGETLYFALLNNNDTINETGSNTNTEKKTDS